MGSVPQSPQGLKTYNSWFHSSLVFKVFHSARGRERASLGVYGPSWGETYIIPAFVSFSRSDLDAQGLGTWFPVVPLREESRVLVRMSRLCPSQGCFWEWSCRASRIALLLVHYSCDVSAPVTVRLRPPRWVPCSDVCKAWYWLAVAWNVLWSQIYLVSNLSSTN